MPLWLRAGAWWLRDMVMLAALAHFLDFTLGWTHAVVGREVPKALKVITRVGVPLQCVGMSACALGLVMSNRAAWMFVLVAWVALLNVTCSVIAWQLLRHILPEVRERLPAGSAAEASVLILEAKVVAVAMLVMAVAVFVGFLPLCASRLMDGALHWPLVPSQGLGESILGVRFPPLAQLPEAVTPNPGPEMVELLIGWGLLASALLSAKGCAVEEQPPGAYIGRQQLGAVLLGEGEAAKKGK